MCWKAQENSKVCATRCGLQSRSCSSSLSRHLSLTSTSCAKVVFRLRRRERRSSRFTRNFRKIAVFRMRGWKALRRSKRSLSGSLNSLKLVCPAVMSFKDSGRWTRPTNALFAERLRKIDFVTSFGRRVSASGLFL